MLSYSSPYAFWPVVDLWGITKPFKKLKGVILFLKNHCVHTCIMYVCMIHAYIHRRSPRPLVVRGFLPSAIAASSLRHLQFSQLWSKKFDPPFWGGTYHTLLKPNICHKMRASYSCIIYVAPSNVATCDGAWGLTGPNITSRWSHRYKTCSVLSLASVMHVPSIQMVLTNFCYLPLQYIRCIFKISKTKTAGFAD